MPFPGNVVFDENRVVGNDLLNRVFPVGQSLFEDVEDDYRVGRRALLHCVGQLLARARVVPNFGLGESLHSLL